MLSLLVNLFDRFRPLLARLDLVGNGSDLDLDNVGGETIVEGERICRGDIPRFGRLGQDTIFAAR